MTFPPKAALAAIAALAFAAPLLAETPSAPVYSATGLPPLTCAETAPLSVEHAAIATARALVKRTPIPTAMTGPLLGGHMGCAETLDQAEANIVVMRSEDFVLQGTPGRIVYNESSVAIALGPNRTPHRSIESPGATDFRCSWPSIGTRSARCEAGVDAAANLRLIALAAQEGQVAGLEVYPALFSDGNGMMDADRPVKLYNSAGKAMELHWNKANMAYIQYLRSLMFEGPEFVAIINGMKPGDYLSIEAYARGSDKPTIRRAEAGALIGQLNTALALADALRKK